MSNDTSGRATRLQDSLASVSGSGDKEAEANLQKGALPLISENATPPSNEPLKTAAADMQVFIGRQLRAVYDDVAKQPIPDRFLELMKQLEGKTVTGQ